MANSTEVFALRREGKINEAYDMALRLIKSDSDDDWNIKAFAYCLNDLIKKAVSENNYILAQTYSKQFDLVELDEYDDILVKTVKYAKIVANPELKIGLEAKKLSFEGKDIEALPLFKTILSKYPHEKDLSISYAWSLYKVLKQTIDTKDKLFINQLILDYNAIEKNIDDEKLLKSMAFLKFMADDEKQIIRDAKEKGKNGNHKEALDLFRQAIKKFPDDIDLNEQFAWQLQKEGKILFDNEKVDTLKVRTLLAEYMKLKNERPSQLHSLFLRFADKIMDKEDFNLVTFARLWDLKNLRKEDFEGFQKEEKTYPSIAEKVIQHCGKLILNKKLNQEVEQFLPFLDLGIEKFHDNIWLKYYKAKLLYLINRNDEAIKFLIPVVKGKISEYWTWNLLAELFANTNSKITFSCYCKSLLCKSEEKFLINVRTKFVDLLIENKFWKEAKTEIELIARTKLAESKNISDNFIYYQSQDWYKDAIAVKNNIDFYNSNKQTAEEFIFHSLPWIDACIGESFTIPDKPNKPRRKISVKLPNQIVEIVISDKKFNTSKNYQLGSSIRIKGELDRDKIFQIYLLEKRESNIPWDIFPEYVGVIDHINQEKGLVHFIVNKTIEGVAKVNQIKGDFKIGSNLLVQLKKVVKEKESYYSVLTCKVTDKKPIDTIKCDFSGRVKLNGAFGFVENTFIDSSFISEYAVTTSDFVFGIAIINFNKKKGEWGWKALSISNIIQNNITDFIDYLKKAQNTEGVSHFSRNTPLP